MMRTHMCNIYAKPDVHSVKKLHALACARLGSLVDDAA